MREIRINPVSTAESVLISTARGNRPKKKEDTIHRDTRSHVDTCPFCKGNENKTPPSLKEYSNSDSWDIRIVENLYPVLNDEETNVEMDFGLYQTIDGYGRHEVIIDHSNHGVAIHDMDIKHISLLMKVYRDRMRTLYENDKKLKYVLIFKNFGPAAGGSIPHTHSQIIATPIIPENLFNEIKGSHDYFIKNSKCIYCSMFDDSIDLTATTIKNGIKSKNTVNTNNYIIFKSKHFVAIKPFASKYEWEVHILPLVHNNDFINLTDDMANDLAFMTKTVMTGINNIVDSVQYNYFIHSIPHTSHTIDYKESFHWHLEICPRTSIPNGFELGSGLHVNTVSPEEAAIKIKNEIAKFL